MWEVIFPIRVNFNKFDLQKVLPVGYLFEKLHANKFLVRNHESSDSVGIVVINETCILVKFFDHTLAGTIFASAFGKIHPEQNPMRVLYGFVYMSPKTHLYQLFNRPYNQLEDALEDIDHHVSSNDVWLVSFLLGEWKIDSVNVTSMRKVRADATLAPDNNLHILYMSQIENENTM